jgi:hypothetical protein
MLTRTAGLAAAAIAGATSIAYVIIIVAQGEPDADRVILVLAMILGAAIAAAVGGSTANVSMKNVLLGGASGGLLSLGYLALFSLGLLLLVAGVVSTIGWTRALRGAGAEPRLWSMLAFLGGAALPWTLAFVR